MRRAALRGCGLLLRHRGSAPAAAGEAIAAQLLGVAAGSPSGGGARGDAQPPLIWSPWPQVSWSGTLICNAIVPFAHTESSAAPTCPQAALHVAAPLGQPAGDSGSGDSSSGGDIAEWVKKSTGANHGKLILVQPGLAAQLQPLAGRAGVADAAELSRAVAALGPKREAGVVEHGTAVAQLLLTLGVEPPQLAELLLRCPYLFSLPPGERAAVLFGQLARLGLTAAEAARCFEQQPKAATVPSFEPAIGVLAPLFAAGSKVGGSKGGERLLGGFLRGQPAAVGLLELQADALQERLSNLEQRFGPHWRQQNKQAVIVAAMEQYALLLTRPPDTLRALEAALQQELGRQPGDGTRLLADILQYQALAAGCSEETLRQRARALVAVSCGQVLPLPATGALLRMCG